MALGKGEQRIVTKEWADMFNDYLNNEAPGIQSSIAKLVGCSVATLTQLRQGNLTFSRWIDAICHITKLPLTGDTLDDKTMALVDCARNLDDSQIDILIAMASQMNKNEK